MTRIEQTVRLAQRIADRMRKGIITEADFYRWGLNRTNVNPYGFGPSDIKASDVTLWHQVQYAQDHLSPNNLECQATELTAAYEVTL